MANWFREKLQSWVATSAAAGGGADSSNAYVTAFGKHPGWDDHIDDIALPTQSLVDVHRLLYLHGIGQNIEVGKWQSAPAHHVMPRFDHWVLWSRSEREFILARLWSSVDGKGRAAYPLVIAAQIGGLPIGATVAAAIAALTDLERNARRTTRADEVRGAVVEAQARLRIDLASARPMQGAVDPLVQLSRCVPPDGVHRLLYEAARVGGATLNGRADVRAGAVVMLRIAPCTRSVCNELSFWNAFATRLLRPRPILVLVGGGVERAGDASENATIDAERGAGSGQQAWVDVICGETTAAELTCLRFNDVALAPTASIPYSIDDTFRHAADASLQQAVKLASSA